MSIRENRSIKIGVIVAIAVVLGIGVGVFFAMRSTPKTEMGATTGRYIALGDSVAAGYGLGSVEQYDYCERTNLAYPEILASSLKMSLTSYACKGAELQNGILSGQTVGDETKSPQLQRLFADERPNLITITAGVNDLDWTSIIGRCYSGVCGTSDDTRQIDTKITAMKENMQTTLSQIKSQYNGTPPKVIVTGYYQFFSPNPKNGCTDMSGVDQSEINWWRTQEQNVNTSLQQAVGSSGYALFAPINFDGHELCSGNSWVQSLQSTGVFHPTEAGQSSIAKAIRAVYK